MNFGMKRTAYILFLSIVFLAGPLEGFLTASWMAHEGSPGGKVAILERLGDYASLDVEFTDEGGSTVLLRDLVDRPTVVALVYLSCRHACPMLLNGLAEVLGRTDLRAGIDFNVVTISFDDRDTPQKAAEKKDDYIYAIGKPFPKESWKFLVGGEKSIRTFTESVGFTFKREEDGNFSHPVTLIILSSEGRVTRYLSGTTFLPFDLEMAFTEASEGRIGSIVRRAVLYCFSYDPASHRYVFNILKVFGVVTVLIIGSFITFLVVTGKRYRT